MSRLFAKTTNYKKHIFEVIEECAHGTAVMLKMCSRFDSKLRLEQLVCYNRSRPPENYTTSSVYPNSQDVSDLGNAFRLSIKTRSLIIKLPNDCPVFILFFNTWYIFFVRQHEAKIK